MDAEKLRVEINQKFGSFHVLDHLSFSVKENEFLCMVGPSGSGKTVLLQLIAGLASPSEGSVKINGEPVNPAVHKLGFVFQEPSCLPWRTLWDDIKFGLEIKNCSEKEINERVSAVIELVGLKGFESYYPHQISGGMKQRVALARALVTSPDLLLMDEPFGSLDAQTRYYMQLEALRIWEEMKTTVVFVTSNVEEALFLGERIIVLSKPPAKICEDMPISLPRPRELTGKDFLELRKKITDLYEVEL